MPLWGKKKDKDKDKSPKKNKKGKVQRMPPPRTHPLPCLRVVVAHASVIAASPNTYSLTHTPHCCVQGGYEPPNAAGALDLNVLMQLKEDDRISVMRMVAEGELSVEEAVVSQRT